MLLSASLIITMPGSTAWAGGTTNTTAATASPTQLTSNQSPKIYNTLGSASNQTTDAKVAGVTNLVSNLGFLMRSPQQSDASWMNTSGGFDHSITAYSQGVQAQQGSQMVTVTDAHGNVQTMTQAAYSNQVISAAQKNLVDGTKAYLQDGDGSLSLSAEDQSFYAQINANQTALAVWK